MYKKAILFLAATAVVTACASTQKNSKLSHEEKAKSSSEMESEYIENNRFKVREQQQSVQRQERIKTLDAQAQARQQSKLRDN